MATTGTVNKSGDKLADGVLSGYEWKGPTLTFAFPDQPDDYKYGPEKNKGFDYVDISIANAARRVLDEAFESPANNSFSIEGFTNLNISEGDHLNSDVRFARSKEANPSAYAYLPMSDDPKGRAGDVWFGTRPVFDAATVGDYSFATVLHEIGHALGLKHGHQALAQDRIKTELKGKHDSLEYSVMTYHSYPKMKEPYYTNEDFGYPQTYMMADIRALQHMYGADYSANGGDTVYSWSPVSGNTFINGAIAIQPGANKIFATLWDGNGTDTYDLSLYVDRVVIDLRPGKYSAFSESQRVDLGAYDGSPKKHLADGNIYNALLAKDGNGNKSLSSLIENAIGGAGNDKLIGNSANNELTGGAGNDVFVFRTKSNIDTIMDFTNGLDVINLKSFDFKNFRKLDRLMEDGNGGVTIDFGDGDVLHIIGQTTAALDKSDFII